MSGRIRMHTTRATHSLGNDLRFWEMVEEVSRVPCAHTRNSSISDRTQDKTDRNSNRTETRYKSVK